MSQFKYCASKVRGNVTAALHQISIYLLYITTWVVKKHITAIITPLSVLFECGRLPGRVSSFYPSKYTESQFL